MEQRTNTAAAEQGPDTKIHHVWVGESDRIASFHAVDGYRRETFTCHDCFLRYLRWLQEHGFRFQ